MIVEKSINNDMKTWVILMCSPRNGIQTLHLLLIFFLCKFFFGCANTPISPIHNIRQIDYTVDARDKGEFKIITFNIRAGSGVSNSGISHYYVYASKKNLTKILQS